jgi:flagellar motor switch protein FliN
MAETLEKQLISTIPTSWNETAPNVLGCPSTLSLLASRDVAGDGMAAALAVAMTWSAAFAVPITSGATGVVIYLLKSDESDEIDRMIKGTPDGAPRPGARTLIQSVVDGVSKSMEGTELTFGSVQYIDLAVNEKRLADIVGEAAHIGTYSIAVGSDINSQALMLYAPHGTLEVAEPGEVAPKVAEPEQPKEQTAAAAQPQPQATRRPGNQKRVEAAPRNIERLLDVELDVIVRFGVTNIQLRDVVRMGVGTMIELNRAVDEPVELLVNGRPLARGEVVVVDGYYGVRITEIGSTAERAATIV